MNGDGSVQGVSARSDVRAGILKRAVQIAIQLLLSAGLLFISSGRLDWWMAWVYLAILAIGVTINAAFLMRIGPELIAERARVRTDAKRWDRVLGTLWGIMSLIALLVAGLNLRFGWLPQIPLELQLVSVMFVALGSALASWALISNAFFAGTVRIQEERGHTTVSAGPYRFVRHPGYAGWMLSGIALALMLGSLWALIPAGLAAIALVVRTALEDRTLREELDGYSEYAQRVRYRLVPGVW